MSVTLNVTTAPEIAAPAESFRVAFTVAGAPGETDVTTAPAVSYSCNAIVGSAGVVGTTVPGGTPEPQPASKASVPARKSDIGRFEIF